MPAKIARKRSFEFKPQLETLEARSLLTAGCLDLPAAPAADTAPAHVSAPHVSAPALVSAAASLVDDRFGQNDSLASAGNLGTIRTSQTFGQLVQADGNDYYRFTLAASTRSSDTVSITFQDSLGDLDLRLYDSHGRQLQISQGVGNTEQVSLANLQAGTYFVRVYGYRGATNPRYSLNFRLASSTTTVTPKVIDDAYENNDTRTTAANLGTRTSVMNLTNLVLADGNDWYRFTTTAAGGNTAAVSIAFQNSQGNLGLQLYSSTGMLLGSVNGAGNSESLSLAGRAAGTYYVRVYGSLGATNPHYSLRIDPTATIAPTPVAATPTPTPPTSTSTSPTTSGSFNIEIIASGLTTAQRAIFEQAAARWESIIVGDLPSANYNGRVVDDLLINASAASIDGAGGILGQAGPDRFRSGSQLPYHGNMQFDSADLATMQANGTLLSVIEHEMGHVLGIGTLWATKGLLVGAGTSNPLYVGRQATAQYNAIFGTSAGGVPVENNGGSGTADAHWRDTVFGNELLTGYLSSGANPLSRITVASLADLGYSVNFAAADAYLPGASSVYYVQPASSSTRASNTAPHPIYDNRPQVAAAIVVPPAPWQSHASSESLHTSDSQPESLPQQYQREPSWSAAVDSLFAEAADFLHELPA
jgi:hypothetical protein